ncbi:glutamate transporter polyphemus [Drosophila innubila]|uniref:glutamate transporter polyphemus n=1 Tax=Drosophila innubila TaxID=198719 RepID=UPI00148C2622|nr:glutamate transporter polyphemus [Drosophila innubila]
MPLAFMYSGIIGGVIMTVFCIGVLIYGIQLLIMCMVESSRRNNVGYMTYHETMVYAFSEGPKCCRWFSKGSGYMVDLILGFSHYGVCVVYLVFVSVNMKQFVDEHFSKIDLRIMIAIIGIFCIPLFLLRQLKYLVPGNILASVLILAGLLAIFWYFFRGLPSITERAVLVKPAELYQIPFALGIVLFATSSVGVMLAIESKMGKPGDYIGWFGVLNIASIFIIVLNVIFGLVGFWRYGCNTEASVTLNIPVEEALAQIIKLSIAIAIFLSYPLSGYVTISIIMIYVLKREVKNPHMIEYIIRVAFVILSTLNAIALPNLGPLLALVGTFSISLLNLVFPCCIELCLIYQDSYGKLLWKLWKNILMILFGLLIFFYGSYRAFVDIIEEYGESKGDTTTEKPTTTTVSLTTKLEAYL